MTDEPQEQMILQLLILQATLSRRCILEKKLNTKNVLLAPLKNSTSWRPWCSYHFLSTGGAKVNRKCKFLVAALTFQRLCFAGMYNRKCKCFLHLLVSFVFVNLLCLWPAALGWCPVSSSSTITVCWPFSTNDSPLMERGVYAVKSSAVLLAKISGCFTQNSKSKRQTFAELV